MRKIRFGIIGCGLMGREFGSAVARWCHLTENVATPEIVGVCDYNETATEWFVDNFNSVKYVTTPITKHAANAIITAIGRCNRNFTIRVCKKVSPFAYSQTYSLKFINLC